jgi:hypothetical protein
MLEEQEEADAGEQKERRTENIKPRRLYPGEKSPERYSRQIPAARQIPTEVYMRRKELLDDVQLVLDIVEPGLSRRRGKISVIN